MTRREDVPVELKKNTSRETLIREAETVYDHGREIEELTLQLCNGLLGMDPVEKDLQKTGEVEPSNLLTVLNNLLANTTISHRMAVNRLNYLINDLCDFK